ncbi:hypothetical protein BDN71DRAFT_1514750 [Pleurotus eryngii]|uniref:Uncharacterized protein n=1 Tax=Pleurotus eryngii TaxID=5323 RepID=A0A9P5ZEA6_PLEER|nr:hypothetical protein BDN71DRAFT_1514750 [Pleurotus eryngii]
MIAIRPIHHIFREPTGPSLLLTIHRNTVTTSPPRVHLIDNRTTTAGGTYLLVLKGNNLNPHEIHPLIPWMTIRINEEDLAEEDLEETEEDLGEMVEVTEVGLEALEEETGDSDEVQGEIGVRGDHSIRFTFQVEMIPLPLPDQMAQAEETTHQILPPQLAIYL